jgi:hypothetical protein
MCDQNIAILIINKLGKLFEEYKFCNCDEHKKKLIQDIKTLGEMLDECSN